MSNNKICMQSGLDDLRTYLISKGFDVFDIREGGQDYKFVIVNSIGDYEELETVSYIQTGDSESIIINGSNISKEEVLRIIEENIK